MRILELLVVLLMGALVLGLAYLGSVIETSETPERQAEIMKTWGE